MRTPLVHFSELLVIMNSHNNAIRSRLATAPVQMLKFRDPRF
jgi:hypothetical protein